MGGTKKEKCHCGKQATYGTFIFNKESWKYDKNSIHCKDHREKDDLWLMVKCENCTKGKATHGISHDSPPFLCTKCKGKSDLVQCPVKPCFKCGETKDNRKGKIIDKKYNCRECVANNTTLPRIKKDVDCQHCFDSGKQKPTEYAYTLEDGTRLCGTCHSISAVKGIHYKSKCGCGKDPAYKIGTNQYCGTCFDTLPNKDGAKRTKHGCYVDGCLTVASIKLTDGSFSCKEHEHGEAVGHTSIKCANEGCEVQPWYGGPEDKTRKYCKEHAVERYGDEVYDFHKKCVKCGEGRVRYRKKDGSYDYCTNCSEEDMESCEKKCIEENCNIRANYGKKGGKGVHCALHSHLNEVHLHTMCNCGKNANYGYKKRTHCVDCKEVKMIRISMGECYIDGCNKNARFCLDNQSERYCSNHKTDKMYDMFHKQCIEIDCVARAYKSDKCSIHSGRPTKTKDKEDTVAKALTTADIKFKREIIIESGQFGLPKNYEIDFLIYDSKRILILECDESQHSTKKYKNDNLRMVNIANQYKHVTFIRYNPDSFRINTKLRRPTLKMRHRLLLDVIKKEQHLVLDDELRIIKVCYDNSNYSGSDKLEDYGVQVVDIEEFRKGLPDMGMPYHG